MNPHDDPSFYDRVGEANGWDFSRLRCVTEGAAWDFYDEVAKCCRPSVLLLDIGTGGAEALISAAGAALLCVGIDRSPAMVRTAERNVSRSGRTNIRILPMEAGRLTFPGGFFDVVSCRHSEFSAKEAYRVLTKGGRFLTQQVAESDKRNLKMALGRGQHFDDKPGTLRMRLEAELEEVGFVEVQAYEYDAAEYYAEEEDLVFLLKHTPIVPRYGEEEGDEATLRRFIREYRTPKGIRTNASRLLVTARKL
ncbi:class I SAM-dependent methyltransferase [Paenibacillus filicis]|uniref:Class I SAM-dependent methyltransferase n=1 Tax=Paenibacillus gyeongsangnamensis TaxID=3388067 RepID=A0ABT4QHB6_9BACL|nr:class I SAM-dependent methyltransferase [Paenibacillus filicis]MCZ8516251.1 class I SAM-dependent methyltransferase [Paenibacillus filicis]